MDYGDSQLYSVFSDTVRIVVEVMDGIIGSGLYSSTAGKMDNYFYLRLLNILKALMDHLVGYDPCEPEESPYRIGCTSVLSEMEERSEKKAIAIMNPQMLSVMKEYGATDIFGCGFLD